MSQRRIRARARWSMRLVNDEDIFLAAFPLKTPRASREGKSLLVKTPKRVDRLDLKEPGWLIATNANYPLCATTHHFREKRKHFPQEGGWSRCWISRVAESARRAKFADSIPATSTRANARVRASGGEWQGDACPVYQEARGKGGWHGERDPVTDPWKRERVSTPFSTPLSTLREHEGVARRRSITPCHSTDAHLPSHLTNITSPSYPPLVLHSAIPSRNIHIKDFQRHSQNRSSTWSKCISLHAICLYYTRVACSDPR